MRAVPQVERWTPDREVDGKDAGRGHLRGAGGPAHRLAPPRRAPRRAGRGPGHDRGDARRDPPAPRAPPPGWRTAASWGFMAQLYSVLSADRGASATSVTSPTSRPGPPGARRRVRPDQPAARRRAGPPGRALPVPPLLAALPQPAPSAGRGRPRVRVPRPRRRAVRGSTLAARPRAPRSATARPRLRVGAKREALELVHQLPLRPAGAPPRRLLRAGGEAGRPRDLVRARRAARPGLARLARRAA